MSDSLMQRIFEIADAAVSSRMISPQEHGAESGSSFLDVHADLDVDCTRSKAVDTQCGAQFFQSRDVNAYKRFEATERIASKQRLVIADGSRVRKQLPQASGAGAKVLLA